MTTNRPPRPNLFDADCAEARLLAAGFAAGTLRHSETVTLGLHLNRDIPHGPDCPGVLDPTLCERVRAAGQPIVAAFWEGIDAYHEEQGHFYEDEP